MAHQKAETQGIYERLEQKRVIEKKIDIPR